jgi:hypothetical protein
MSPAERQLQLVPFEPDDDADDDESEGGVEPH